MRESGVLLPVSSLPSRYGIGSFSKEAYEFIDFLKRAGQKKWQVLPLGPTGYGDSPYQSFSTFAGNPYFIDLDALIGWGLLSREECDSFDFGKDERNVDYGRLYEARNRILHLAFTRFQPEGNVEYERFCAESAYWLEDYSLFMVLKDMNDGKSWNQWEEPLRNRHPEILPGLKETYAYEMSFYRFQQYMFRKQWENLHRYAAKCGIEIIGDIPIYVAFDSADTWANPELFQFDENHEPAAVAGCPPDAFSADGQLWGNPLYNWEYHRETGYKWWISRVAYCLNLYDVLRVDHFRGFDAYYSIPAKDKTAENGHWEAGPGKELFQVLRENLGEMNIIAEDLGYLTDSVIELVRSTGFPGMKVLQFAFDSREEGDYLPHNYEKNCVVYTGTHDNDTIRGWYEVLEGQDKELSVRYMNNQNTPPEEVHWDFIRLAMASVADLCIIPLQDYLGLGSEARINTPSVLGGNWKWRMRPGQLNDELAERISQMTRLYGR